MGKGRTGRRSLHRQHGPDREGRPPLSTCVQGIAQKAQEQPKHRFGNLYELLNEAYLRECWGDIRKDAASGVDHVSAEAYAHQLEENSHDLGERLKGKRYRAKRVKRHDIPKGDGHRRPLGIPAVADKLRQRAVARILEAIYAQDFRRGRSGSRPKVGALDAVDKLTIKLQFGQYHFVVEADIKGFFDNIQHDWLIRLLEERLEDGAWRRLMRKWLKAGVLETDGQVIHPVTGTPQGGVPVTHPGQRLSALCPRPVVSESGQAPLSRRGRPDPVRG
jgi:RNA-directed DNA polymerase